MDALSIGNTGNIPALALPMLLSEWLCTSRHAHLLCDARQHILWQNTACEALFGAGRAAFVDHGRLVLAREKASAALVAYMQESDETEILLALPPSEGDESWVLQCRRLQIPPGLCAFGIRIASDIDCLEGDYRHFETHFRLTPQEEAVCRLSLQGNTVLEISAKTGKSPDTIRFHIRNLYQKVGVSSREALFASLRQFLFA